MNEEAVFWGAHVVALVGWIVLVFAPRPARVAVQVARGAGLLLAVAYAVTAVAAVQGLAELARNYSLAGVGAFFTEPRLQLLGWIHYLVFDLWIATWEVEEAERAKISRSLLLPCLVLTCLVGPIGLLTFLAVRATKRRNAAGRNG
jgi:Domain of unknown function (DUF4281)